MRYKITFSYDDDAKHEDWTKEDYDGQNLDLYNLNDFRTLLSYLKQLHKTYGIVKLTITGLPERDVIF